MLPGLAPQYRSYVAGGLGFEPRQAESESAVLPLDDPPMGAVLVTYSLAKLPTRGRGSAPCGPQTPLDPGALSRLDRRRERQTIAFNPLFGVIDCMTLILSNDDVEKVLSMPDCMDALEDAYVELAEGSGVSRRRSDSFAPTSRKDALYSLKSMDGICPKFGVGAVRINSDI